MPPQSLLSSAELYHPQRPILQALMHHLITGPAWCLCSHRPDLQDLTSLLFSICPAPSHYRQVFLCPHLPSLSLLQSHLVSGPFGPSSSYVVVLTTQRFSRSSSHIQAPFDHLLFAVPRCISVRPGRRYQPHLPRSAVSSERLSVVLGSS